MSDKNVTGKERMTTDWKRPDGPPVVWQIVEGQEKLDDGTVRRVRFSIQEIPEDRYSEAVEHMCKYFITDETSCKYLKIKDDPDAVNDFREVWNYIIKLGLVIGAYTIDDNKKLLELAGVNFLFIETECVSKVIGDFIKNFKSEKSRTLFGCVIDLASKVHVQDIYGVDFYMTALGLSVEPRFRGCNLGLHLLKSRDDIGRKYGILATSTTFTAVSSQIQAGRAGFEVAAEMKYEEMKNKQGDPIFSGMGMLSMKQMIKRLS